MTLTLSFEADTQVPIEVEGLTPDAVRELSLTEIERFTTYHGNREVPLAEFFKVAGDPSDQRIVFQGELSGVHWIGTKMQAGEIRVEGNAGRHVGSELSGGVIRVDGNVGDWLGGEMRGGLIDVRGSAGHLVGAAYRGSPQGMTNGTILVHGQAGNEVGLSMRRGLVVIGQSAGDLIGFNMLAGTILVLGEAGIRPGAEMRRGTIGLLGKNPPKLLPTFRYGCQFLPPMMPLLQRELQTHDFPIADDQFARPLQLYHGDLVSLGRGEILLPI